MTLIHKDAIGHLLIKPCPKCNSSLDHNLNCPNGCIFDLDDCIEIVSYSDGIQKPCIYCDELTTERDLGSAVCSSCKEHDASKCKQCKWGVKKSTFHTNGNDWEDHFTHYIACAMRDYNQRLRDKPDFECAPSAWHISPLERKKCFTPKETLKRGMRGGEGE